MTGRVGDPPPGGGEADSSRRFIYHRGRGQRESSATLDSFSALGEGGSPESAGDGGGGFRISRSPVDPVMDGVRGYGSLGLALLDVPKR